jgi:hypothetical protein
MVRALKQIVTIQRGGSSSELPEGASAEVIVLVDQPKRTVPLVSLIGKSRGSFTTPKSVDDFLREERDS